MSKLTTEERLAECERTIAVLLCCIAGLGCGHKNEPLFEFLFNNHVPERFETIYDRLMQDGPPR